MKDKKREFLNSFNVKLAFVLVLTIVLSSSLTYGFFYAGRHQEGENVATTTCFNVEFTEGESINLAAAYSMSDAAGQKTKPYTITIKNTCAARTQYNVVLSTLKDSFDNRYINVSLDEGTPKMLSSVTEDTLSINTNFNHAYVLTSGYLSENETKTIDIRAWINAATTYEQVKGRTWEGEVKVVSTVDMRSASDITLAKLGVTAKTGNPTFANAATTDEGVYAMADDYGTSYYYRGAVTNNYVKYGQNKSGQDMWWRIIRINGDGSLRIIYDGTQSWENGVADDSRYAITNQPWNTNYDDAKYVGWMFGGAQGSASTSKDQAQTNEINSDAKTAVDNWYKENIVDTGYAGDVVDRVFCNDRSIDSGNGYAKGVTYYGSYARLGAKSASVVTPKFTCETKNDAFTVEESETTNGALTYPVGLITADEIVTAGSGGYGKSNKSYYLYKSSSYYGWSLSPYYFNGSLADVMYVDSNGTLDYFNVSITGGAVAPVINLSAEYVSTLTGVGTIESPYQARRLSLLE